MAKKKKTSRKNVPKDHRRAAFLREYLLSRNATDAARRAGYSVKTARAQGCRLLTDADIMAQIEAVERQLTEKYSITLDAAAKFIGATLHFKLGDVMREGHSGVFLKSWDEMGEMAQLGLLRVSESESQQGSSSQSVQGQCKWKALHWAMKLGLLKPKETSNADAESDTDAALDAALIERIQRAGSKSSPE